MILDNSTSTEIEQYLVDENPFDDNISMPEGKCMSDSDVEDKATSCITILEKPGVTD